MDTYSRSAASAKRRGRFTKITAEFNNPNRRAHMSLAGIDITKFESIVSFAKREAEKLKDGALYDSSAFSQLSEQCDTILTQIQNKAVRSEPAVGEVGVRDESMVALA